MRLTAGKIEKCKIRMRKFAEFQEVDPLRSQRPIRPALRIDVVKHFAFFAALQWHAPHTVLFVLRIIKVTPVKGFHRRDSAVPGQSHRCSPLCGGFPDLKSFRTTLRSEIDPLATARPAWRKIVGSRYGWQHPRDAPGHFHDVNLTPLIGVKLEGKITSIRRPACAPRRAMQRCNLIAPAAVDIACPDIPKAQAIRLKHYFLA